MCAHLHVRGERERMQCVMVYVHRIILYRAVRFERMMGAGTDVRGGRGVGVGGVKLSIYHYQ